jgi:hypothetical protein
MQLFTIKRAMNPKALAASEYIVVNVTLTYENLTQFHSQLLLPLLHQMARPLRPIYVQLT